MRSYCANSEKAVEILPVCCLLTDDKEVLWCRKIIVVKSHLGFRHEVKFCSDPFRECNNMSEARLHFQEKDKVKNIKKKMETE